jgi:hypothetical protein
LIDIFQKICKGTIDFLRENGSVYLSDYRNKILELSKEYSTHPIDSEFHVLDVVMSALNITRRVSIDYQGVYKPITKAGIKVKFKKDLDENFWRNTKSYEEQFYNVLRGKGRYRGKLKK